MHIDSVIPNKLTVPGLNKRFSQIGYMGKHLVMYYWWNYKDQVKLSM